MMAEPVIKDICNGSYKDVKDELQESDERGEEVSNRYFVRTSAVSLRNNLSKDHNGNGRYYDCQVAWNYLVQEYGESLQSKRI